MRTTDSIDAAQETDPVLQAKAQTQLDNLGLADDLEALAEQLRDLFEVRAPMLERLTTPQDLASLIQAIRTGAADNRRLAKFLDIANHLSALI